MKTRLDQTLDKVMWLLLDQTLSPSMKTLLLLCFGFYPQVHESLKHTDEEHVHLENPLSSSGTLSSMKNLDDAFTYGDQFLNDKPSE
ncbi:hypothetical protein Tco_0051826 [Tanacetum coccineum]